MALFSLCALLMQGHEEDVVRTYTAPFALSHVVCVVHALPTYPLNTGTRSSHEFICWSGARVIT